MARVNQLHPRLFVEVVVAGEEEVSRILDGLAVPPLAVVLLWPAALLPSATLRLGTAGIIAAGGPERRRALHRCSRSGWRRILA